MSSESDREVVECNEVRDIDVVDQRHTGYVKSMSYMYTSDIDVVNRRHTGYVNVVNGINVIDIWQIYRFNQLDIVNVL